jgi:sugar O-acyltransferase (sialic acid O-acetyltransferase NeuD family)
VDKENLILLGGGGHAKACLDVILSTNKYTVTGYIDIKESTDLKFAIPYLGQDADLLKFIKSAAFLITVGQINSPAIRTALYQQLKDLGASLATVVSAHAYVSPFARLDEGTIIMHGAIVQFNAVIGANCIINDRALIEHDTHVGNHCHISTGAILNGDVIVKNNVFVGSGSIVKNGVMIAENVVIGAGSNVLGNISANSIVFGNPAKIK